MTSNFAALLLAVALLASGCGPALTMRRLSPPKAALGTARSVYVQVTPAPNDVVDGEAEPVSQALRRRLSERLVALGYTTCPELPCGEGVLRVVIEQSTFGSPAPAPMPHLPTFDMMDAAMRAVKGQKREPAKEASTVPPTPPVRQVEGVLRLSLAFEQTPGEARFRHSSQQLLSRQSTPGAVMKEAVESAAKVLDDELSRQLPLVTVTLEGGGPLDRGVELLHAADWAGAASVFAELTRTRPELDGAWYDLGFALEAQNAWGPALEAYRAAAARAKKPHYEKAVRDAEALTSRR